MLELNEENPPNQLFHNYSVGVDDYSVGAPTLRSQLCLKRHLLTLDSVSVGAPTLSSLHFGIHRRCKATASER
jgi:hypothetical protein